METQRIVLEAPATSTGFLIPATRPGAATLELGATFNIGRDLGNHLVLNDPFVSARHARIDKTGGTYTLRDLHSSNGTFLNGSRVTEAVLGLNDRIRFGEHIYVFSEAPRDHTQLSSKNHAWNEQLRRLPAFAGTEFPVLITGPSGSGKEILARAIHRHSTRSQGPFISINCSALNENLIESELFGHVKGSFTGATHDRKGAFETARGGTLFLDEIGDLPLSLQPKLLRAIENSEIRPVGADRSIATDVRIVAATHKNLPLQTQSGRFREDLYYRLNVCQLIPPSLSERLEDFDDLIYGFARQMRVRFSFNAIETLKTYSWPGNIRELRNLVSRASAYFPGKNIQPEDLTALLDRVQPLPEVRYTPEYVSEPTAASFTAGAKSNLIKEFEREMIIRRLIVNGGNQRRTAQDLGLPKSTLHDRIKTYAINLDQIISDVNALKA